MVKASNRWGWWVYSRRRDFFRVGVVSSVYKSRDWWVGLILIWVIWDKDSPSSQQTATNWTGGTVAEGRQVGWQSGGRQSWQGARCKVGGCGLWWFVWWIDRQIRTTCLVLSSLSRPASQACQVGLLGKICTELRLLRTLYTHIHTRIRRTCI